MNAYTVSEFVTAVSAYLEQGLGTVVVQGEVTGYRIAKDRLVYFELKDASARVLCFAIVGDFHQPIEDGMEIRVTGSAKLFKATGGFHLRVIAIELVGAGALQRAFELTKQKLERDGLFAPEHKKPLPRFPEVVGIVTSKDAAAFTDVVRILNNRWGGMHIVLAPAGVQGPGAIPEIVEALRWCNENGDVRPDVLIVTRGGGSLEDLQAFNSEDVCRAIFSSRIPVVCGVGHERDTTLAELVADVRASTPSNAAERVVPDRRDIAREVNQMAAHFEDILTSA
ncbi:MAG: exodeoxyribonuclease VII large subunit, partial [bacterium]|nr:exodeoxyribonuclease VII large subunit [bacterium]